MRPRVAPAFRGTLLESEWRLATVCLLHAEEEPAEELVPKEHQARGEGGLQQAVGRPLKQLRALSSAAPAAYSPGGVCSTAPAPSGLRASDLQALLEEVQGVGQGLADDAGSAATEQVSEVRVLLATGWRDQLRSAIAELEAGVGGDGNQHWCQAFVENQGPFPPVHGDHSVSQGLVYPGLSLSCKTQAQNVHRVHCEGGHAGRQAATQEVHGEIVGIMGSGSVDQLRQQLKFTK